MKHLITTIIFLAAINTIHAQNSADTADFKAYTTSYSEGKKVLRGLISRSDLMHDTAFEWFNKNYDLGGPQTNAVAAFKQHAKDFQIVVFGGTWCPDTQNLLPQLYQIVDASKYDEHQISLIAVDRDKTTLDNLATAFKITSVPTFIIMQNGKEAGRVVEYGKTGNAMKELGEIVSKL